MTILSYIDSEFTHNGDREKMPYSTMINKTVSRIIPILWNQMEWIERETRSKHGVETTTIQMDGLLNEI